MNLTPIDTKPKLAKVISLTVVRKRHIAGSCQHNSTLVDEELNTVECADCGALLNPMAILARMARQETNWANEHSRLLDLYKKLEHRTRCKCQHCGQMTRIKV